MRKLTWLGYVRRGGYVLPENVPFKEALPLKLKNQVSGKSSSSKSAACVQEMSVLLSCLKKNDFKDALCPQEVANFYKCHEGHMEARRQQKESERRGELTPGERKLSYSQANILLKLYPLKG